ncbi:glycosyltransferase family 2 protein [Verrucomicrobiota bacterium]
MADSLRQNGPDVTVVIPCLNEEETILGCIEAAKKGITDAGITGEIIVSDNGSTDGSAKISEDAGARVVHCEEKGYGRALLAGFAEARGEWIVMGDADQSYDFTEIPRFHTGIREGHDLVMGTRLRGTIEKGAMPWLHQYIGNPFLTRMIRLLFGAGVSDVYCGLRAFRRDLLEKIDLRSGGMELATEMVIKATRARLKITEIPIVLHKDARSKPPHLHTFRDGWRTLRYMLMMAPNWLFIAPGLVTCAVGSFLVFVLLPGPRKIGGVNFDVHTMLLGMSFVLLGVYVVIIGLFVKVFTHNERLAVPESLSTKFMTRFRLEYGLLVAAVLITIGLAGDIAFVVSWKDVGFGDLDIERGLRVAILYTTILVVGIEILFASFFMSMLGISRDTYIGQYETK